MEEPYKNREIDEKFSAVHDRFDVQDRALAKILSQTTATNGKVRKIIIALVLVIGFILGTAGKEILPLISALVV